MNTFSWLIPIWPLLSFLVIIFFMKQKPRLASLISMTLVGLSFLFSILSFFDISQHGTLLKKYPWFSIGDFQITAGFIIDELNALMLVLVSLISLLIHIYSLGYMEKDRRLAVYYAYLDLFTAAMLGLVISPNLLQIYLFWELVGLGSFLLIGFHYTRERAKRAATKAFIMTRIGDVGFLIGIILLFLETKSFDLDEIFLALTTGNLSTSTITLGGILIFIGAVGKSAQFPLFTWLPDAMEGPTPVSALIHAATMVAAGVYIMAVLYPLLSASGLTLGVVTSIGLITAFLSALIALVEKDVKRVLAYSTVSQLGLMMIALGTWGAFAAIFHLTTHAFFKALLFLAAGSIILATGTQNIEQMGGIGKKMPKTAGIFLIGALAISGFPLFSGFFSKEAILNSIYSSGHGIVFVLTLLISLLTTCYIFRLYFLIFTGKTRGQDLKTSERTDARGVLFYPMAILALFSIIIGWFGCFFGKWLGDLKVYGTSETTHLWLPVISILCFLLGLTIIYFIYGSNLVKRDWFSARFPYTYRFIQQGFYLDALYNVLFVEGLIILGKIMKAFDRYVIGTVHEIIQGIITLIGFLHRKLQNGQTQSYGFVVLISIVFLIALSLWTGGYLE